MSLLGLDGPTIGNRLFKAFDVDQSGDLDFKEMFLGMSLLINMSNSGLESRGGVQDRLQDLEIAFMIVDGNNSGTISKEELEEFLTTISPRKS